MIEVVIFTSAGSRNDQVGIYIDDRLWWNGVDYAETYPEKLIELLLMPGEKHVTVEEVDEIIAEWMGLHQHTFLDTLTEWRAVTKIVTTGRL